MSSHDSTTKWSQQRAKDYQAHPIDPQKVGLTSDEIGTRAVADLVSHDVPRDEIPAAMLHSSVAGSAAAGAGSAKHAAKHPGAGAGMAKALGVGIDLDDRGVAASTLPTGSNAPSAHAAAPGHKKGGMAGISNLTASDPARGLTAADLARGDNIDTASRYSGVRTAAGTGLAAAAAAPLAIGSRNQCDCTGDRLPDHWQTHHSQSFPASSRSCDCSGDLLPDHWQTHHAQAIATPIGGPGIAAPHSTTSYGYSGDIASSRGQGPSDLGGNISPRARTDLTARDQIPDEPAHKKSMGEKIGAALGFHHSSAPATSSSSSSSSTTASSEAPAEKKSLGQKIGAALGFGKKKRRRKSKGGASTAATAATAAAPVPFVTRKFGSDLTHDTNVVSGADMSAGQGLHREASLEPAPRHSVASEVGLNDPRATQAAIDSLPSGINDIKIQGIPKEVKTHKRHESVVPVAAPVVVAPPAPVVQETYVETQPAAVPERMETVVGPPTSVYVESIEPGTARPMFQQPEAPLSERVVEFPVGGSSASRSFEQQPYMQGGEIAPSYSSSSFSSETFPASGSSTSQLNQFAAGAPTGSSSFGQQQQQFPLGSADPLQQQQFPLGSADPLQQQQFSTGAPTGSSSFGQQQQSQIKNQPF